MYKSLKPCSVQQYHSSLVQVISSLEDGCLTNLYPFFFTLLSLSLGQSEFSYPIQLQVPPYTSYLVNPEMNINSFTALFILALVCVVNAAPTRQFLFLGLVFTRFEKDFANFRAQIAYHPKPTPNITLHRGRAG